MSRLFRAATGGDTGSRSGGEGASVMIDIVLIMVHGLDVGCLAAVLLLLLLL